MLKLTKKRFTNKRKRNISSIRRKRMASRRKRQVGGTLITLPKELAFRIYPQPGNEFTDSNDCINIQDKCDLPNPVIENCNDKIESCYRLSNICPAKWHTVTKAENIYVKIPKHFVVTATCTCLGITNTFSDETDVFSVLNSNYMFKIEYAKETANPDIHSASDILANTKHSADIHHIVVKSQSKSISLDELRKIMNYYFFKLDKKFVQYIGEFTELKSVKVIAWTDIRNDETEQKPCSSIGQHSYRTVPPCATDQQYSWFNASTAGEVCKL